MGNFDKNMLERIMLGDIRVKGKFDIVVKDELTGRIAQELHEHNYVTPYTYAFMRSMLMMRLMPTGFYMPYHQTESQYTEANYIPFYYFALTNGLAAEGTLDATQGIDGTVLAAGSISSSATSGTIWGAFNTAAMKITPSSMYKRWDWASTNGNGTFTKAMLLNRSKDWTPLYSHALADMVFNGFSGSILTTNYRLVTNEADVWAISVNGTATSFTLYKRAFNGTSFDETTYSFTFRSNRNMALGHTFFCIDKTDSTKAYIGSSTFNWYAYLDLSSGTVLYEGGMTQNGVCAGYNCAFYCDSSGNLRSVYWLTTGVYHGTMVKATGVWSGSLISHTNTNAGSYNGYVVALISGNIAYCVNLETPGASVFYTVVNLSTGAIFQDQIYTTSSTAIPLLYLRIPSTGNFSNRGFITYNGTLYMVWYYYSGTSAYNFLYLQEITEDILSPKKIVCTEKLLSSSVTKTSSQSMYAGYTIEFE